MVDRFSTEKKIVFQYFRTDGLRNYSIDHSILCELPISWRRYWRKLDLTLLLSEEEKELERIEETPERKIEIESRIPVNVKLLSRERKIKVKAIALGEVRKQMEEGDYKGVFR